MKLYSGACERNQEPIAHVLSKVFVRPMTVLEVASGTGMHAAHFAAVLPHLVWQPSDVGPDALASVSAWCLEANLENIRSPLRLDMTEPHWDQVLDDVPVGGIFNANMVHISPWAATEGLLRGASRLLPLGAALVLYGPFRFDGQMSVSNQQFDVSLQSRDSRWGVRDFEAIQAVAEGVGLSHDTTYALPANNHILVFRRT